MSLFSESKEKSSEAVVSRKYIFETDYPLDRSNWFDVYSACLGPAMIIQKACAELVVKDRDWEVDFGRKIIAFGDEEYPVQFIGSEANSDNSWMWGWDNINGFDESVLTFVNEVKAIGEKWGLQPLTVPSFEMSEIQIGHTLAMVACGVTNNTYCYYRGPYNGGAAFLAFSGVPEEVFAPVDLHGFCSIVMNCLREFPMDHKIFVESLLMWNGTGYDWENDKITAHFGQDLEISFESADDSLRIKGMKTV